MATFGRRERAVATLSRLLALPGPPPVIVVDDASPDGTAAAVRERHPDVQVIQAARNLGSAARNLGVAAAATPYVAFVDDDSWWDADSLDRAADVLDADERVGLVAAAIDVGDERRADPTNHLMADSPLGRRDLPGPEVLGFVACGAVVRRDAFLAIGGFAPHLHVGGEEELLAIDLRTAGWRCVHVPDVRAHHLPDVAGERPGRRQRVVRNRLWTAWIRRPWRSAARITGEILAEAVHDPAARAGLAEAVAGAGRLRGRRRPVPADVERDLRRLETTPR